MPFILTATDDREATEATANVLDKRYRRAATDMLPEHAGSRSGTWVGPVYNAGAPALARIRGGVVAALYAGVDYEIACVGDSKTSGQGVAAGRRPTDSWPGVLARALGGVEGFIVASSAANDSRWSGGSNFSSNTGIHGLHVTTPGSPATITLTVDGDHTGGAFCVQSTAGGVFTVTVDGGAAQSLAVPAGSGYHLVGPTAVADGPHTYVIATTADLYLFGFRPTYDGPQLRISNMGYSGATAANWLPGNGMWEAFRVAVPTPDAVFAQLGTNSPSDTASIVSLWTAIDALTAQSLIIAPGGIGPAATYAAMYLAVWDQADRLGLPLVDFAAVIGDYDAADAAGLMFDSKHENALGYAWEAAAIRALLGVG